MKRIAQLDGVRGVAILLVLVWHYFSTQVVTLPHSIGAHFNQALSITWSGVDLFFVLSGFLIAGILLDHRETSNYFRVFYLRRVCRIFPVYFLVIGVFFLLTTTSVSRSPSFHSLFRPPLPLWSYVIFAQNILMGAHGNYGPGWLAVTWSLAVEEQFYLFVPLLIYFLPRRTLVCVLVFAILAAPPLRVLSGGFHAEVNTLWRADSLLSGALLAVMVRWPPFLSNVQRARSVLLTLFGVLLAGAAVMSLIPFGAFGYFWLACLYSTFILIAFLGAEPILGRILESPILLWFGKRSYGIYLLHEVVRGLLNGVVRHGASAIRTLSDAGLTLAALGITLALAALSFRFLEAPLLRLGHQVKYLPRASNGSRTGQAQTMERLEAEGIAP